MVQASTPPARKFDIWFRQAGFLMGLASLCLALPAWAADSLHVALQVSDYNGYQVSCFGLKDGSINLTVWGGTPPYSYRWSNGTGEEDLHHLPAGYYKVEVSDNGGQSATAEITLEQPLPMKWDVDVYEYPNGYNVSCFDCYNGNASVVAMGGAEPFTVSWSDGPTGAIRTNLGPKDYKITVVDANACAASSAAIYLRGPDRSDWSMGGNANTTPGTQYIGTPDHKDVVFKSNGQERLRILGNGEIQFSTLADTVGHFVYVDTNGVLKRMHNGWQMSETPWYLGGNDDVLSTLCRIGTLNNMEFHLITNGTSRMLITRDGKVGIGTTPPAGAVEDYRLYVENGIVCRDVLVKLGDWPDYVFQPNYALMPLDEMREFLREHNHLPGIPSAAELAQKGGVEVGDLQTRMLKVVEEQALYILQLEEKLHGVEQRLRVLEASQR